MTALARLPLPTILNYAALGYTAAAAALIHLLIARLHGAVGLGVFAQVYAVYVILAQVAVAGVHDSTQSQVARLAADGVETIASVRTAVLAAALAASPVALLTLLASPLLGRLLGSEQAAHGIALAAPGIALFACNKVQLAALVGQGRLAAYAIGQAARASLLLGAAALLAASSGGPASFGAIFTIAEALLFAGLLAHLRWPAATARAAIGLRQHLSFGARGLVNSVLAEAFIRIDVLVVSLLLGDREVGIYAFAALFVEGLYQVPSVLRTLAYRRVVALACGEDRRGLPALARILAFRSALLTGLSAALLLWLFPPFAQTWFPALAEESVPILRVLVLGMVVHGLAVPLDQVLLQAGMPGRQSLLQTANLATVVLLTAALTAIAGLGGAAWAMAASLALAVLWLDRACRRWLGLRGGLWLG